MATLRTRFALLLASVTACLVPADRVQAQADGPVEQAVRMVNQGDVDPAIQALRDHLEKDAKDARARGVLGQILDFDGRPDEAVALWEGGLTETPADFPFLMAIGRIRHRQGTDGLTIRRRRGTLTASPSKDRPQEDRYKRDRLAEAATAYRKARTLRPDEPEAARALASVYTLQEKHDAAVEVWAELVRLAPRSGESQLGLALALRKVGRNEEAAQHLERSIELDPRLAEAYKALAEDREQEGKAAEAEEIRKRAAFFERIPPFSTLSYSEENLKTLDELGRAEAVRALADDPSERASEFLAVLCWSHPHNQLEAQAFDALEARGDRTTPLLRALLEAARSTCTIRSTAHILARRKADGMYDYLVEKLPGDLRGFAMDMDIAGSLDDLGDPRAVAPLAQFLNPGKEEAPEDNRLSDRNSARGRAALALGAFDTPEAREALEAGTKDSPIAAYCLAALYRLTKDPKRLEALEKSVGADDGLTSHVVGDYLQEKVGSEEAKKLAQTWEKRRETRRAEVEAARKKQGSGSKPRE